MKRWIVVILLCSMILAGCVQEEGNLMAQVQPQSVDIPGDMAEPVGPLSEFGIRLTETAWKQKENILISPVSILSALGMTANGAGDETLNQMESVFGMPVSMLNDLLYAYGAGQKDTGKLHLANSIWFLDDPSFTVNRDFLQVNADYYGADAFLTNMDKETLDRINAWVAEHTDNLIPKILDQIPAYAVMYLVNALAFEDEWEIPYDARQIRDWIFTTEDGRQQEIQMMFSEEEAYLEDDLATGFIKYYKDRDYAFAALLPKDGVSVRECLSNLSGEHLYELLSHPQMVTVHARLPLFEAEYGTDLNDSLREMGVVDAFDPEKADLTGLGTSAVGNIYISRIIHKTFIRVDDQGTKAAAATIVEAPAAGAPMEEETVKTVLLDRPFVYFIIDCETMLPLFVGTMMEAEPSSQISAQPSQTPDHSREDGQTTVHMEGEAITLTGEDSAVLADLLRNLDYDPMKICRCMPQIMVKTDFAEEYGIHLENAYARSSEGQADLTREQLEIIWNILERIG